MRASPHPSRRALRLRGPKGLQPALRALQTTQSFGRSAPPRRNTGWRERTGAGRMATGRQPSVNRAGPANPLASLPVPFPDGAAGASRPTQAGQSRPDDKSNPSFPRPRRAQGPAPARGPSLAARRSLRGRGKLGFDLRSEEHTSELQSLAYLVCRLLLEKKKKSLSVVTI